MRMMAFRIGLARRAWTNVQWAVALIRVARLEAKRYLSATAKSLAAIPSTAGARPFGAFFR
jgi:hypothetical protein